MELLRGGGGGRGVWLRPSKIRRKGPQQTEPLVLEREDSSSQHFKKREE